MLKQIFDDYIKKVDGLKELCDRCLKTERYGGNVVLMIVDASFVSIGLCYFTTVIPKVMEFKKNFVDNGKIVKLSDLVNANMEELRSVWKNKRSWEVAKGISNYLSKISDNDKEALRKWAMNSKLHDWKRDPIGSIKGIGLITYQYLRMMGGVDTVMPDRIVKKVINEIFKKAGLEPIEDDLKFIIEVEKIAKELGYRAIELCWMTWFINTR
ncbi:MAG: hypothetical protein QW522_03635, partial [Candidatus Methanomethyliaceae archaeon]